MKQSECCSAVAIRCGKTLDRKGGREQLSVIKGPKGQ